MRWHSCDRGPLKEAWKEVPAFPRQNRAGFTIMELAVAMALLAVLLVALSQMMVALSGQQRTIQRYAFALAVADNLLEELSNRRWEELEPTDAAELEVPSEVLRYLSGATATATVVLEEEPVEAKRLSVALDWKMRGGQPGPRVRLTAWVFPAPPSELE